MDSPHLASWPVVLAAATLTLGGCTIGFDPGCGSVEEPVEKDEPQADGRTAADLMEGLDGEQPIRIQWQGRNDASGFSFDVTGHATTGTLRLSPDWASARQLNGGAEPCGDSMLAVEMSVAIVSDDGAIAQTFEVTVVQDGEDRELERAQLRSTDLGGSLELSDPQPPQLVVTNWLLDMQCASSDCTGQLLAVVDDTPAPMAGSMVSIEQVPIASFATQP